MQGKRKYKDSLFRHIFNDKKRLASLYLALSGEAIRPRDIRINTLRGVFFNDVKNDISFRVGDKTVVLIEQQSSWNPNMPLRMLWYIARIYRNIVDRDMAYRSALVALPEPEFYVLYNGTQEQPPYQKQNLADAFGGKKLKLDLEVDCYNINLAKGRQILEKCEELRAYSVFVAKVRELTAAGETLTTAIRAAIRYCEDNDCLASYFKENESEVYDMVSFKWDDKRAQEIAQEEGEARGEARGIDLGIKKVALKMLRLGRKLADIMESTELPERTIRDIAQKNGLSVV